MKFYHLLAVLGIPALLAVSCDSDSSTSPGDTEGSGTGVLKLLLTDAPAEYDSVNVTFSEVSVHFGEESEGEENPDGGEPLDGEPEEGAAKIAGEWIVLSDETQTFNLLELNNGATALLGEAVLDAGHYTQLRLEIVDAEIVIGEGEEAERIPLTIPSGSLKFVNGFDVIEDMETEIVVDFDAARSVHVTGNNNYKLIPTIRVITDAVESGITGTVLNPENNPIAYAIAGEDTVTSSYVKTDSGKFTLGFLEPGTYTVAITDTLGLSYENPGVTVADGAKHNLGDITLE